MRTVTAPHTSQYYITHTTYSQAHDCMKNTKVFDIMQAACVITSLHMQASNVYEPLECHSYMPTLSSPFRCIPMQSEQNKLCCHMAELVTFLLHSPVI